jgi:membrane fusion protein, multidrug efflux system
MANAHESVTPGTPLIEIIDERDLDARVIVPSRWLSWIKVGKKLKIRIEELNKSYSAHVRTIGSRVDPVSQSIEITAGLLGDLKFLKPGMSGVAVFSGN